VTGNGDTNGPGDQASLGAVPPSFGAAPSPESPPEPTATDPESQPGAAPGPATSAVTYPPESGSHLPAEPAPGAGAEPTVGWYPSSPVGSPSAGPFAAPSAPARRGLGAGLLRSAGPARATRAVRSSKGTPAWRNSRSRLANVLLFGIGPLVLAGVVVAAFLLVSPGKGSASSLGFQAGPGATASPASASVSPTAPPSSPAVHGKHRTRATPSPSVAKVPTISTATPKAKSTPKPAHRSGGGGGGGAVTPHNLGLPNFAGYCQHIGDRTAELIASNAYGWRCTLNTGHVLQVTDVCAWTYHLNAGQVVSVSANYADPNAWQCWRIDRDLGVLDVGKYCVAAGLGASELVADNAYGWYCTSPSTPVNTAVACDTVYHVTGAVARFAVFADPYSWQCWD
jgi:hypothetical protein